MFGKLLVECCAPTLAGLKTANMFTYEVEVSHVAVLLSDWNKELNAKGVTIELLRYRDGKGLFYVYRPQKLTDDLSRPDVRLFLQSYGYGEFSLQEDLERLKRHMQEEKFPHEIGLFLSYPLEDVVGFIENAGQNCKCVGCWKVYSNECEKVALFDKFKKCKSVYTRLFATGRTIQQLTVIAS